VLPGERSVSFPIDSFSKTCLLNGVDQLGYLLRLEPHITAFEERASRALTAKALSF
jgi:3-isopropylmalate/(R)-2-methylmalate dehydratase small subunit